MHLRTTDWQPIRITASFVCPVRCPGGPLGQVISVKCEISVKSHNFQLHFIGGNEWWMLFYVAPSRTRDFMLLLFL
jgi:hypothetical protein